MLTGEQFRLDGQVAIVTGSGRNIGQAVAEAFAAAGARVVVNGHRDQAAIEAVAAGIRERGGEAIAVLADVAEAAGVRHLVDSALRQWDRLDVCVSNVAIRLYRPFLDISPAEFDDVLHTNLVPAFHMAQAALPHMIARGRGRLIHISGWDAFYGHVSHRAASVAAKAGLHGLTMALAREFGDKGVTVNEVSPGPIDTVRDWSQYPHQEREKTRLAVPLLRFGAVEEVAGACLFLASDAGGFVSGQAIQVNGGAFM